MTTQTITSDNFNQVSEDTSGKLMVVDFWAEWCGPCKMLAPVLDALSNKYGDEINFFKLDTDTNPDLAQQYQITSIPCNIFFKDGKEVHRVIGHKNEAAFDAELSAHK